MSEASPAKHFVLSHDESLDAVNSWFACFGLTDANYLRSHFSRFKATRNFALSGFPPDARLTILDVGAHWLHNAFFYANLGHSLIVTDAPDTLEREAVKKAAAAMGADIRLMRRMEKADGLSDLADDSIDLVLFCEVIEHMAFNPIPFWKQVYRVLRPGGHAVVTTPHAFYYRNLTKRLASLMKGESIGLSVAEIHSAGTYGHHWKEFTIDELGEYFAYLSPDFDTSRFELIYHPGEEKISIEGDLEKDISQRVNIRAHSIFLDVLLREKVAGIQVKPPWEPM